jgi:DNA polymerase III delta prime subunit
MTRVGDFWVCPQHGTQPGDTLEKDTAPSYAAPSPHPLSDLVAGLPFPLALLVSEYLREENLFIKLHRLTDAAEIMTRFTAMVLVSDVLRERGEFPPGLRRALSEKIERPTFGAWKDIVAEACASLPKSAGRAFCFVAELPAYVKAQLLPRLGAGERDAHESIIALRNLLAHSGRLATAQAQQLLDSHRGPFEDLVGEIGFLQGYDLVACAADGRALSLRGFPQRDGAFPPYDTSRIRQSLQPERVLLVRGTEALDLFPLQSFSEVIQRREERIERLAEATPQLYFRLSSKGYLEFTPMAEGVAFTQQRGSALERFWELFRLEEWRRLTEAEHQRRESGFEDLLADLGEVFVGRELHVDQVKARLKAQDSGVLWISGQPGVGKSALMARLVRDFQGAPHWLAVPYFFRIGRGDCSTDHFIKAALLNLSTAMGEGRLLAPTPEERRQQFVERLGRAAERLSRKVLLLVDGLDEIYRIDKSFVALLSAGAAPRVVWLCAGRSEPAELEQALRQGAVQWVFPDGLPPLDEQAVRALLTSHLDRLKYRLFARDELEQGEWHNRFVEVLLRKSEGLPLYVRMVIDDLCTGKWTLEDEARLPDGLKAYFDQILERLRVSDAGSVLTPLFCLLVWAKEPVTEPALKGLLGEHHLSRSPRWDELFERALQQGHLMLRRAPTPEDAAGWTFYHDSFRQHLRESATVMESREWAKTAWIGYGARWRELDDPYLLRHLPAHLYEAGAGRELVDLLCGTDFLAVKVARLKDPFRAAQDVRWLTLTLLDAGSDQKIVDLAVSEQGYLRDGIVWGLREGLREDPGLAPRIRSIVEGLLATDGAGKPSAFRRLARWLHPRSSPEIINARRAAIEVAYHLDLGDCLQRAAADRSPLVRALLPPYLYRFWERRRAAGWQLFESMGSRMLRLGGLPDRRLLEACGGMSLAILMQHADDAEVLEDLRRRWQPIVRRVLYLGPLLKAAMFVLTRNFRWLMARQADYQPLNLRELHASYSGSREGQRAGLEILKDLAEPARGIAGTLEVLLDRDRPFDVYVMLVAERTLVYHGSLDPGTVMAALHRLHREGCRWFRQSALYAAFHTLHKAQEVEDDWLQRYSEMTRETVEEGRATYPTEHGRYTLVPHMAWAELVFDRHRPQGHARFIPAFLEQALGLGDNDYAGRALAACGVLALVYSRFDLALDALRAAPGVRDPHLRDAFVQLLANLRLYDDARVDQFLDSQAGSDLERRVAATSPLVSSSDIATWIDDFMVVNLIRSDKFRAEVVGAFERAGHARSPNEVLQQVLRWGMDLIEGRSQPQP